MAFTRGDPPPVGSSWGPWTYVVYTDTIGPRHFLQYSDRPGCSVRLDSCTTSAEVLDWIMQIYKQPLMAEGPAGYAAIGHLIEALDDLLYPQQNLCSGGESKTMEVQAWLHRKGRSL